MGNVGPRNRDYNVSLRAPVNYYRWNKTTQNWDYISTASVVHRTGKLTVNNPWRPNKPQLGWHPTSRSIQVIRTTEATGEKRFLNGVPLSEYRNTGVHTGNVAWLANSWKTDDIVSQLRTEAILDALAELKDQKWNAGVTLAESQGVARMVVDAAQAITRIRERLHRREYKSAYRLWRESFKYSSYPVWREKYWRDVRHVQSVRRAQHIPEGWLYYHYGIKPTIDDIDGAVTELLLKSRNENNLAGNFVNGYAKFTEKAALYREHQIYGARGKSSRLRSMRVKLHVTPKPGFAGRLSQLGVTNPPEAIWNAIPFSFLVDYFTSVGDWLSALDSGIGWQFGAWEEILRDVRKGHVIPVAEKNTLFFSGSPATYYRKDIIRTVKTNPYGPMGTVLPQLKLKNPSAKQVANILSLLATGFGKPVRP